MHRFGDQIEFRVDRRYVLLFFVGAVCWTLITFLFGMLVAGNGKERLGEKGLMALGWLDKRAAERKLTAPSGFVFSRPTPKRAVMGKQPTPAQMQGTNRNVPLARASQPTGHHQPVDRPAPRARIAPAPPVIRRVAPPMPRFPTVVKLRLKVSGARYGVELRFLNSRKAAKMKRTLRGRSIRSEIALTRDPKRGRYYRLLLGRFRTLGAAKKAWKRLGYTHMKGGVIRLR